MAAAQMAASPSFQDRGPFLIPRLWCLGRGCECASLLPSNVVPWKHVSCLECLCQGRDVWKVIVVEIGS